jgi:hypothetical protein
MADRWVKPLPDERLYIDEQAKAHAVLSPFKRQAPPPLQGEQLDQYERRLTYEVQKQSPRFKDYALYDTKGDAFKIIKDQIYADAAAEARHPTMIPEGELREVVRHDNSGRPFLEFFGSPKAWLKDFTTDKKKLVGIRGDGTQFIKP